MITVKTISWGIVERRRIRHYRRAEKTIAELFLDEGKAVVKAFYSDHDLDAAVDSFSSSWRRALLLIWRTVIKDFGGLVAGDLGGTTKADDEWRFDPWPAAVREAVQRYVGQKVTYITDATKDTIARVVGRGIEAGKTIEEIGRDLEEMYGGFETWRAQLIARTEVVGASNFGMMESARQSGLDLLKGWRSMQDDRVRDSHAAIDGQVVELEEFFGNGLLFPGSPDGPAEEVINCRCSLIFIRRPAA